MSVRAQTPPQTASQRARAGVPAPGSRSAPAELAPAAAWIRIGAAALGAIDLLIGVWGTFLPRSFYDTFPGASFHWVDLLGPYDTHLVTDVGEAYLMMAVLLGLSAWYGGRRLMQVALITVLVQAVPHCVFHLTHLGPFSTENGAGVSLSTLGSAIVPLALLAGMYTARRTRR